MRENVGNGKTGNIPPQHDPTTEAIMIAAALSTQDNKAAPSTQKQTTPSTTESSAAKATMTAALQTAALKVPRSVAPDPMRQTRTLY